MRAPMLRTLSSFLKRFSSAVNTAQPMSIDSGMYGPSSSPSDTPDELGVHRAYAGASLCASAITAPYTSPPIANGITPAVMVNIVMTHMVMAV